jgi:hypothetical protein
MADPSTANPHPGAAAPVNPDPATPPAQQAAGNSGGLGKTHRDPSKPDAQGDDDPMRELLQHLQRAQPMIATLDRSLAQTIHTLTQQGADPETRAQPGFRHQVAYALQDLEKLPVWPIQTTPELRAEMTRLAVTAPGLENASMLILMQTTSSLHDKQLIRDIREAGTDIGVGTDQNTAAIQSRLDVIENRVRLALHPT